MANENLAKKTVRELKLNDYVVVDANLGAQQIEVSVGQQTGEELAKISIDGEEFTICAPEPEQLPEINWLPAGEWTDKTSIAVGQLFVGSETADVRMPSDLAVFSNETTRYQTRDDVVGLLQSYQTSSETAALLAEKATKAELGTGLMAKADVEQVALDMKYLSSQILANQSGIAEISDVYVPAQLANYTAVSAFSILSTSHAEDIAAVNKRCDNIASGLKDDGAKIISELSARLVATEKRLDNIGSGDSSGSGVGQPLSGQKISIENSTLTSLLDKVLKALGANGGTGPLSGTVVEIEESNVAQLMRLVLETLGAEVVD